MKDTKYKIYILIEIVLFALLLVFQIIYIANGNLLLMSALILIFISDLSIALSIAFKTPILINIMCLITWPTYVIGCILINSYYKYKKF